jgi:DNA-binding MarR family transcriptional regulator
MGILRVRRLRLDGELNMVHNLRSSETILIYLLSGPIDSASILGRRLEYNEQTVRNALKGLREKGMVLAESINGRQQRLSLTDKGRAYALVLREIHGVTA